MNLYVGSIALTIAGNIGYHLLNKSVAPNAHPFASLVATYGVGPSRVDGGARGEPAARRHRRTQRIELGQF